MGHIFADILFVLVAILLVVISAKRGFFKSLMRFAKIFLAIGAAYLFGGMLKPWIASTFPAIGEGFLSVIISYAAMFLLAMLILTVVTWFVGKLMDRLALVRRIDTVLGALVGLILAVIFMFVAASIIKIMPSAKELYENTAIIKFFGNSSLLDVLKFLNVGNLL